MRPITRAEVRELKGLDIGSPSLIHFIGKKLPILSPCVESGFDGARYLAVPGRLYLPYCRLWVFGCVYGSGKESKGIQVSLKSIKLS